MSAWSVKRRAAARNGAALDPADALKRREFVIEESLGYLVNRAARSMASQLAEAIRPAGVGIGQWAVLMFLWADDGLTQAELSRVVAIEPPTMVRTIDRMVRDGLVRRQADARDGRLSRIFLTDLGRSLRDELVPKAVTVNATNLGRLSAIQRRTLRGLLGKLVDDASGVRRVHSP